MDTLFERLRELARRIGTYSPLEVLLELIVIGVVIYGIVRFVQGTRAAGAIRGLFVLLMLLVFGAILLRTLGGSESFPRLKFLSNGFLQLVAVALVVVFQPELRRALIRLGETPFFRASRAEIDQTADALVDAAGFLSKARFGALMVLERNVGLQGLVEGGTTLNAEMSARILQTIFFPGSALHDLAVVIRDNRVHAAGVQLPLADPEEMPDPSLGSRHRAAVGLTRECDAVVIVVSEETGNIRIAERGKLSRPLTLDDLRDTLRQRLQRGTSGASSDDSADEEDLGQALPPPASDPPAPSKKEDAA
ncbi:MAG: TIGR00159 family protein [Phycisphaeraceae bacterium]|nr:TIGR00159 family protein [Phycisphaeraceae bacterium]